MTTKQLTKIKKLEREVTLLRSFFIGIAGEDKEGEYRPEFVREIMKSLSERPTRRFRSPEAFLAELREV